MSALPYPEELKLDEFIAALELLWAVPGLLAWSALPGDEGLLEFPGEHDDVTVWQRKQNKTGISFSCQGQPKPKLFRHNLYPSCYSSKSLPALQQQGRICAPVTERVGVSRTALLVALRFYLCESHFSKETPQHSAEEMQ